MTPGAGHGDPTLSVHAPESAVGRNKLSSELGKRFGNFLWKCKVALQCVELGWREALGWARRVWGMLCPSRGVSGWTQGVWGMLCPSRGVSGWTQDVWGVLCPLQRGSWTLGSELLCDRTEQPLCSTPHPGWGIQRSLKAQQHQAVGQVPPHLWSSIRLSFANQTQNLQPKKR